MAAFIIYIIRWGVVLTLLYSLYGLLMKRETLHGFNRLVLLAILVASMVLPLCQIKTPKANIVTQGREMLEQQILLEERMVKKEGNHWIKDAETEYVSNIDRITNGALAYDNPRKTYLNFRNNLLMIYKNMPQPQLCRVMISRFVLDYVAALQELVSLKPRHFAAIIRARIDYLRMKRDFTQFRRKNLTLAKQSYPDTISRRSIIFDYYIRRMKE